MQQKGLNYNYDFFLSSFNWIMRVLFFCTTWSSSTWISIHSSLLPPTSLSLNWWKPPRILGTKWSNLNPLKFSSKVYIVHFSVLLWSKYWPSRCSQPLTVSPNTDQLPFSLFLSTVIFVTATEMFIIFCNWKALNKVLFFTKCCF